jgi:hypothetical protein
MKRFFYITTLVVIICSPLATIAQSNQSLLTNNSSKKWRLADMYINNHRIDDSDSTCIYEVTITFNTNGTYIKATPCSLTDINKYGTYTINDSALTIDNFSYKLVGISAQKLNLQTRTTNVPVGGEMRGLPVILSFKHEE